MRVTGWHGLGGLKGEICCVVKAIRPGTVGKVNMNGSLLPASSDGAVGVGRWAKVVSTSKGKVRVAPLNAWLGSCCR